MILLISFSTLQQSDSLMRSLFTIIIFVTTSHAHAQISRDSLIGSWLCTQVKELPDPELKDPSIRQSFDIIKAAYNLTFLENRASPKKCRLENSKQQKPETEVMWTAPPDHRKTALRWSLTKPWIAD